MVLSTEPTCMPVFVVGWYSSLARLQMRRHHIQQVNIACNICTIPLTVVVPKPRSAGTWISCTSRMAHTLVLLGVLLAA
jgi:hypothetical protein